MFNDLIPCKSCQKDVAVLAVNCPACGAPNDWVHPLIAAIDWKTNPVGIAEHFDYYFNKTSVWGQTPPAASLWGMACLGVFILISLFAGVAFGWQYSAMCGLFGAAGFHLSKSSKSFKADLQTGEWQSNDDEFWQPIKSKLLP